MDVLRASALLAAAVLLLPAHSMALPDPDAAPTQATGAAELAAQVLPNGFVRLEWTYGDRLGVQADVAFVEIWRFDGVAAQGEGVSVGTETEAPAGWYLYAVRTGAGQVYVDVSPSEAQDTAYFVRVGYEDDYTAPPSNPVNPKWPHCDVLFVYIPPPVAPPLFRPSCLFPLPEVPVDELVGHVQGLLGR